MEKEQTDRVTETEPRGQEAVGKDGDSEFMMANFRSGQFSSVPQLCSTLCDPMDGSTPGLPVHRQLLEFTQTHVH